MSNHVSELINNKVSVTLSVSSNDSNHNHLSSDHSFDLLLHDVVATMEQYPSMHGDHEYRLCPRWQYKDPKRRDVHVFAKDDFHQLHPLGKVSITKEKEQADLIMDKHQVQRTFHLNFKPEEGRRFITAEEFHSLYTL